MRMYFALRLSGCKANYSVLFYYYLIIAVVVRASIFLNTFFI